MKSVLDCNAPDRSLAVLYSPRHERTFSSSFEKAILKRFLQAYERIKKGDIVGSAEQFKGVGFGLTPSGDDFIIGLLHALSSLSPCGNWRSIKNEIMTQASGCAPLSRQFMRDAEAGICSKDIKELFTSAQRCDEDGIRQHLLSIMNHGHSSGADTIAGMIAGFEWFFTHRHTVTDTRIRG
jgi:hypothetical protein